MHKKIIRTIRIILWLIVVGAFIAMEIYNFAMGNYRDLALSLLIVVIPLLIFCIFYFTRKKK
jgi:hypothetical protein